MPSSRFDNDANGLDVTHPSSQRLDSRLDSEKSPPHFHPPVQLPPNQNEGSRPPIMAQHGSSVPPAVSGRATTAELSQHESELPGVLNSISCWIGDARQRIRDSLAFSISLVFHLGLLLILALIAIVNVRQPALSIVMDSAPPGEELDLLADFGELPALEDMNLSESSLPNPEVTEPEINIELDLGVDSLLTSGGSEKLAAAILEGVDGGTRGGGASFFGVSAGGSRFVFVVDSSTSMLPKRWARARRELESSLNGLGPDQKYFVICFDAYTHTLFTKDAVSDNFVSASPRNNQRVKSWMRSVRNGPDTRPADAMRMALNMEPDAIFLLSDGELKDNTIDVLQVLNQHPLTGKPIVPIHTISLLSEYGQATLQRIASENGGTFTAHSRND